MMQFTFELSDILGELLTGLSVAITWLFFRIKSFKIRRQLSQILDKANVGNGELLALAKKQGLNYAVKEFEHFLKKKYSK